jgi:23S rRNA (cytidine1920-2'-O)/16S rRNA (cytidine1409-2'-O)-methyltransferase
MVERALVGSRSEAEGLIGAGRVLVGGAPAIKASRQVAPDEPIVVTRPRQYVSRAGEKLAAALDHFGVEVSGRRALDAGSSTGGFTDCLLQRGAASVEGFDVGRGQLDASLRSDPRVRQTDAFNVRHLGPDALAHPCSLAVIDVSFISLRIVAGPVLSCLTSEPAADGGSKWNPECVMLVKPQFEASRREVSGGRGVIRDPSVHERVCREVSEHVAGLGWQVSEPFESPLLGGSGNKEFLLRATAIRREGASA